MTFLLAVLMVTATPSEDWVKRLGGRVERDAAGRIAVVNLRGSWVTDTDLAGLSGLGPVQRLDLGHTRITDQALRHVARVPGLKELDLHFAEQITDAGIAHLRAARQLRRLILRGTKTTDTGMETVTGLHALVALDLAFTQITDAGVSQLGALVDLRELMLGGNKLTDRALTVLHALPALEALDLSGMQRTDSGLWSIAMTDAAIEPIASLKKLRRLYLGAAAPSGAALVKLAALPRLQLLDLHGSKRVGDDVIPALTKVRSLRWVDVDGTAVSTDGARRLRAALPGATVLGDGPAPVDAGAR